ncbi:uncharacterized protein [Dysidea avara]|uniref:uncharacterized protein isoform X1 n=1 Tax=Dysidea avara TaxID=196820 RepID=UPI0033231BB3
MAYPHGYVPHTMLLFTYSESFQDDLASISDDEPLQFMKHWCSGGVQLRSLPVCFPMIIPTPDLALDCAGGLTGGSMLTDSSKVVFQVSQVDDSIAIQVQAVFRFLGKSPIAPVRAFDGPIACCAMIIIYTTLFYLFVTLHSIHYLCLCRKLLLTNWTNYLSRSTSWLLIYNAPQNAVRMSEIVYPTDIMAKL